MRLIQGLALGGEWGGGLLLAVEYAPRNKRGLYGAVPQTGALLGLALGALAGSVTTSLFSAEVFKTIGWRIPFLLSVFLILIGLYIRSKVGETPSFVKPNLRRFLGAVGVLTCWFARNTRRNVVTNLLDFGVIWR